MLNHPLALVALNALPGTFDRERAGHVWREAGVPSESHDQLWDAFETAGVFARLDANAESWWDELGWREARSYHEATRDYPFLQMDQRGAAVRDEERMEGYAGGAEPPSVYQHLGGEGAIALEREQSGESVDDWIARLHPSQRRGLAGVSLLFDVCFGERGRIAVAGDGSSLLKSIPSGGARHPTEVFLAAFDLEGIPAGVYHYDVEHHRLESIRPGDSRAAFESATLDLFGKHDTPPAALLVFTSLVERAMWRYRDPRSFRAILVDVGHAVMAYRQVARMLGFRTYAYQKMRDRAVCELLGIDAVTQPPLYVGSLVA